MVLYPVPTNDSSPWAITVDPRGIVWFLEHSANTLASYDPASGTFYEYPIPTPDSSPESVAVDSSGDAWFTELTSNRLGELPYGGTAIVEYSIPALSVLLGSTTELLGCGPGAITTDPSGTVWVACLFSNQIDEFFPGNRTFASFDLPVFQSGPAGMVLDGRGDLWFTAADADMLGEAVISQLRNGTSDGITEFPPVNSTYVYEFTKETSFLGGTTQVKSSLPTPTGIAIGSDGNFWVTEHVDSSFDSYDPNTGSLTRYWTSQTYDAYGYPVSFPNGIAVGKDGTVWIAEHYGDRIAEFDPTTEQLTEYSTGCCLSSYAGTYTLAVADDGTPWFVAIQGNAIGELVPNNDSSPIEVDLATSAARLGPHGTVTFPFSFSETESAASTSRLSLNVSGVSSTGALENMTAAFSSNTVDVAPGHTSVSNLTLSLDGLAPGEYYLTLTASSLPDVLYSVILKLAVTGGSSFLYPILLGAAALVAVSVFLSWRFLRSSRAKADRRSNSLGLRRTRS